MWIDKERLLYSGGWQPRKKADPCPKEQIPHCLSGGKSLLKGEFQECTSRGRAVYRMPQSALIVISKFVI